MTVTTPPVILKVGGSLVVPKDVAVSFLKDFVALILKHVSAGKRFVIITGGGYTNRWYRDAAVTLGVTATDNLHWLGIQSTRLNAELLRALFASSAHEKLCTDPHQELDWQRPILIAGGFEPGYSNDNVAVKTAERFGAKTLINMSDVAGLYDADPGKYPAAKVLREITWKAYREMFGNPTEHIPAQHIPIDAIAAITSQELGLETFFIGSDLGNLNRVLSGELEWTGTRIY